MGALSTPPTEPEQEELVLNWQARTSLLLRITIIVIVITACSWAAVFLTTGNVLGLIIELFLAFHCLFAYFLLRLGLVTPSAHAVLIAGYIYVLAMILAMEGLGHDQLVSNHYFLIAMVPAVFIFLYETSTAVRYAYSVLLLSTFLVLEFNLFGLHIDPQVDAELAAHGRTSVIFVTAVLLTVIPALFARQIGQAEAALVEVNNELERIVDRLLPKRVVQRLRLQESVTQDHYTECTILVADIVGFTPMTVRLTPEKLLELLNDIFAKFDDVCEQLNLEKIKTIGDAYIAAGGIPDPMPDHALAVARAALRFQKIIKDYDGLDMRIGIHSGAVNGGLIGKKRFIYDLWGQAVTIASSMESNGMPGKVQVSHASYLLLKDDFELVEQTRVETEWGTPIQTYLLEDWNARA